MSACAITDHGFMGGVVEFYKAMTKAELKPLLGVEAYITQDQDDWENDQKTRDNAHMILIAKDNIGYSRLLETVSKASFHNFYYKPRITEANLEYLSGHVVATTACLAGVVSKELTRELDQQGRATLVKDTDGRAARNIKRYLDIFSKDFYLEVQVWDDGYHHQSVYNQWLLEFGQRNKIPFVITADAHYLDLNDHKLHEFLMAMQLKVTLEQYKQMPDMQYGPYFYLAPPDEMLRRAQSINCEEAYYNTEKIAEECNVKLELGTYHMPEYKLEDAEDYQEFLQWKKGHHAT
jgi:DNA polymerase-3 subunit alpha